MLWNLINTVIALAGVVAAFLFFLWAKKQFDLQKEQFESLRSDRESDYEQTFRIEGVRIEYGRGSSSFHNMLVSLSNRNGKKPIQVKHVDLVLPCVPESKSISISVHQFKYFLPSEIDTIEMHVYIEKSVPNLINKKVVLKIIDTYDAETSVEFIFVEGETYFD